MFSYFISRRLAYVLFVMWKMYHRAAVMYTEQCRQMWDDSLTRAFNLLAVIDKFEPGVVNRKYNNSVQSRELFQYAPLPVSIK